MNNDYVLDSDIYFNFLFYSCGFLLLWKQLWLLPLLTIPVIVFLSKRLWYFFGMHSKVCSYIQHLLNRFEERKHSLISVPVEGAIVLIQYIHRVLLNTAKESVDSVSSGAVILVLLISLSIAMLFISIQVLLFLYIFLAYFSYTIIYCRSMQKLFKWCKWVVHL